MKKIKRTLLFVLPGIIIFGGYLIFQTMSAEAVTIEAKNPLEYSDVNSLAAQIRKYFLLIIGGIAIVFLAVSGILYAVGGMTMNEGMINASKKALVGAVLGLAVILAANTILQELYYIVLGKNLKFENLSAKEILLRLTNFLLAILGTIFLIMTIVGGIWYFAGGGDESKVELGKKTFIRSVIGLTIALSAMIIIRQIDKIVTGGTS